MPLYTNPQNAQNTLYCTTFYNVRLYESNIRIYYTIIQECLKEKYHKQIYGK